MKKWGRRIRGAIGMGLTWAAAGFGAGIVLARVSSFNSDLPFALLFAPLGFLAGVIFSGILVVMGHRGFDRMSLPRFAGWGAVGGLLLSGILAATAGPGGEPLMLVPVFALAGAGSAAGTLAIARMAEAPRLLGNEAPIDSTDGASKQLP